MGFYDNQYVGPQREKPSTNKKPRFLPWNKLKFQNSSISLKKKKKNLKFVNIVISKYRKVIIYKYIK